VQYSCDGRAKGETLGHGPASVSGREMGDWPAASIGNGRATAHASINAAGASSAEVKLRARDAAAGGGDGGGGGDANTNATAATERLAMLAVL
jgi:hypothetical protein